MSDPFIDYCGVRIGTAGISLIGHGHGSTLVRSDIQLIEQCRGFTAERPAVQCVVGLSLGGWAAWLTVGLLSDLCAGNGISAKPAGGVAFLGLIGIAFAISALRRGPYLRVHTPQRTVKFPFTRSFEPTTWSAARSRAATDYGYHIIEASANSAT